MSDKQIILKPEHYYHIYNHAVGNENLFDTDKNYIYFLVKFNKYILPVSELITYCLMPNHFHLIVRLKSEGEIKIFLNSNLKKVVNPTGREAPVGLTIESLTKQELRNMSHVREPIGYELDKALSQLFSNFFNTYAKHYNFWKNRTGTLFKRAFRRKEIGDMEYLRKLICYIHQNPVKAGLVNKCDDWEYSSYQSFVGLQQTLISRKEIIKLFGDLQNFKYCHSKQIELETE